MSRMAPDTPRGRRSRRRFDDDFKTQAVGLILDEGKSIAAVARDLDLTASVLGRWVTRARADRTKGRTGLTTAQRKELARLRKESRILQEERDIPKKGGGEFRRDSGSSRRRRPITRSRPSVGA
jgi:transposase